MNDSYTVPLMTDFWQQMAKNPDGATALRAAQLSMITQRRAKEKGRPSLLLGRLHLHWLLGPSLHDTCRHRIPTRAQTPLMDGSRTMLQLPTDTRLTIDKRQDQWLLTTTPASTGWLHGRHLREVP